MSSEYLNTIRFCQQKLLHKVSEKHEEFDQQKTFYPVDIQGGYYITEADQVIPLPQPELPEGLSFNSFELNIYKLIGTIDYNTEQEPDIMFTLEIAKTFLRDTEATTGNQGAQLAWFTNGASCKEAYDFELDKNKKLLSGRKRNIDSIYNIITEEEESLKLTSKQYRRMTLISITAYLVDYIRGPQSQDKILVFQFQNSLFYSKTPTNIPAVMNKIENLFFQKPDNKETIMWVQKFDSQTQAFVYNL